MAPVEGRPASSKHRPGVCHRCGWKGPVVRVSRRLRRELHTGHTYGRLCDDCVAELVAEPTAAADQKKPARLRSVRNRKVA